MERNFKEIMPCFLGLASILFSIIRRYPPVAISLPYTEIFLNRAFVQKLITDNW